MNILQRTHLLPFILTIPYIILVWFVEWITPSGVIWWTVIGLAIILMLHTLALELFTAQKFMAGEEALCGAVYAAVIKRIEDTINVSPAQPTAVVPVPKPPVASITPIISPVMNLPTVEPHD